jgi:hypothetical protein
MIGTALTAILVGLAAISLALAAVYAVVTLVNLAIFRAPPPASHALAPVSILIPARNEAAHIGAAARGALAQEGVKVEAIVLDDNSTDATAAIVRDLAAEDRRVRLVQGAPLPAGWNGKQHACHQLATAARHPVLLFVDADVRLAPDAAARLQGEMKAHDLALVSGFPRQVTGSLGEALVIPQIMVILLGYLPFAFARRQATDPRFAAGCGQLMMVTAEAYARAGGHAGFRRLMHDGLNLPRNVRRSGGRTDIVDATPLAACRMYEAWRDLWAGFTKNATEGMATRRALPVWTVLLGGGHVLPWGLLPVALLAGSGLAATLSAAAIAAVLLPRAVLALRLRQPATSVLLHPVGVAITLAIQYAAFTRARRGGRAVWRGRSYDFQ